MPMPLLRRLPGFASGLVFTLGLFAAPAAVADPQLTPLVADVLETIRPVPGSDGKTHLVYELRLANATDGSARIEDIEVVDAVTGAPVARFDEVVIAARLSTGGRRGHEAAMLGVSQFGVAFLHVALPTGAALPQRLAHRVRARFDKPDLTLTMTVGEAAVSRAPPIVLGRPLRGEGYLVGDGCCDTIRHVRALLPLDGRYALAQRFAIDWEQADATGRLVTGDTATLANYRIHGREVLAPADGTVVASRDDLPEQVPGALPPGLPIDEADGNFAILDIGGGAFVLLAHMQPGSVTVKAGDRVRRGDVLGRVGSTGNSQAPHLHLHVMDGPSPLLADGLPYVIDTFAITARDDAGTADFDRAEATGSPLTLTPVSPPVAHRGVLPLDLSIVDFGP